MSQQLLRRAWDQLDSFKQAYPENWNEDDQQVMDDLLKADLDLSGVKRTWAGLTQEEVEHFHNWKDCTWSTNELVRYVEATLRSKNT